jgi:hypothetical protein
MPARPSLDASITGRAVTTGELVHLEAGHPLVGQYATPDTPSEELEANPGPGFESPFTVRQAVAGGARPPPGVVALLSQEHCDALDLVASGVDACRVSSGTPIDAVAGAVAREDAV